MVRRLLLAAFAAAVTGAAPTAAADRPPLDTIQAGPPPRFYGAPMPRRYPRGTTHLGMPYGNSHLMPPSSRAWEQRRDDERRRHSRHDRWDHDWDRDWDCDRRSQRHRCDDW